MSEIFYVATRPAMNLNPGATLQNQKYVIQKQLHQSDFGAIYQARHAYLEQDVTLQTLNGSLRQRPDFDQLRQQFLQKVRSIAQTPSDAASDAPPVRILDCFEEAGMPFVVFERSAGQVPVQLADWFPLMPHTVNAITPVPGTASAQAADAPTNAPPNAPLHPPTTAMPVDTLIQTPVASVAPPTASVEPQLPTAGVATQPVLSPPAQLDASKPIPKLQVPARSASKLGMPLALLVFSMFGGLLGAGLGLAFRLAPTAASDPEQDVKPNLPSSFLSREQSFPAAQDWPITETPQFFSTDPLPVEEPVYRGSPTDSIVPDYPIPSAGTYQPPVIPSERPAVKSVAPPSPVLPTPVDPSPVNPLPVAPEAGSVSAEPIPEITAPSEPAPPAIAEPAPPPAPAPILAPAPPAEPAPPAVPVPANPQ